jgi:endonuclease YncB( thermonuclease family)
VADYSKNDRYGRILGIVMVNGEDVNLEQIEAGMA